MLRAPAKQNATDTINTLSGRLASATLLEDRRAATLGLRSFAKEYPASVASGALRGLINNLTKDAEDIDTLKISLETLLNLFNPNESSPEASEDISLWLADEFTQRQDNITILLDLLETSDFYPRLYSLQLISAISSARLERTQECILSVPLGTTRLVSILDDTRDAIRNVALLLLTDLTSSSSELQKLVTFESAFERILKIIASEGSLALGGIVVQDCIALLANLFRGNLSNQALFRESGLVSRLGDLLPGGRGTKSLDNDEWSDPQSSKNLWGLLALFRMFLAGGSRGSQENQKEFDRRGVLRLVLDLGFDDHADEPIRAEAIRTCADVIRGHDRIQERFAQLQVAPVIETKDSRQNSHQVNGVRKVFVIEGLLDLVLAVPSSELLDVRMAACDCIQAYFYGHSQIKKHFLGRATEGHQSGQEEHANILTLLLTGSETGQILSPYQLWFAAVLMFHLTYEDPDIKRQLMEVSEGDTESGEEPLTCIQALAGHLLSSLQGADDERISVGYLMLLCGWLFEDPDAVNDFLTEGSNVQILVQIASSRAIGDKPIGQGLCVVLIGILYEFSTKDSPIPRRLLQSIIISGLVGELYRDKLYRLRQDPQIRDFDVLPPGSTLLDPTFVDFLKDNYSRFLRAIDKDPRLEAPRVFDGVDRDVVDSLQSQLRDKAAALQNAESQLLTLGNKLAQSLADCRRIQEQSAAEVIRIKSINEALHKGHEADVATIEAAQRAAMDDLHEQHQHRIEELSAQLEHAQTIALTEHDSERERTQAEVLRLSSSKQNVERILQQVKGDLSESQQAHAEKDDMLRQQREELDYLRPLKQQLDDTVAKTEAERTNLKDAKADLEDQIAQQLVELEDLRRKVQAQGSAVREFTAQLAEKEASLNDAIKGVQTLKEQLHEKGAQSAEKEKLLVEKEEELTAKEAARDAAQTELDDLLIILTDSEDKRARDKTRLRELGQEVSDVEDGGDEAEEEGAGPSS